MIQQGVSVGGTTEPSSPNSRSLGGSGGNEMTIGKVMDWIEARLEAIKSREEEEDEDEEKERTRNSAYATTSTGARPTVVKNTPPAETVVHASRGKVPVRVATNSLDAVTDSRFWQPQPVTLPLTPNSPTQAHAYAPSTSSPPSPSPPTTPSLHRPTHQLPKSSKARVAFPNASASDAHKLPPATIAVPATGEEAFGLGAGAKRRHAVMMMLDSAPSPLDISADSSPGNAGTSMAIGSGSISHAGGRRRTRSTRVHGHGQQQPAEAMDVEEDGRERKRVARR